VTEYPGFGVLLARLLEHRGTGLTHLAAASGIAEPELRSLIDGTAPGESQLRDLAPALGFHTADLFVIAHVPVPEDLTPLDPAAGREAARLLRTVMDLPPDRRRRIHRLVEEMPQQPRPAADPAHPPRETFHPDLGGAGAMLVTMLWANRNLGAGTAEAMDYLTRGRIDKK
jgi:hypothetical protein